ncbi:hypothetical protein [uncultured Lactobacillus sp.]|nr:hypothetical protein [uncultured Lactobacillus sp.]
MKYIKYGHGKWQPVGFTFSIDGVMKLADVATAVLKDAYEKGLIK